VPRRVWEDMDLSEYLAEWQQVDRG
jgi:hypothetical protein